MKNKSTDYLTSIYWFMLSIFSNVGNDIISKYIDLHFFEITFFRFFFASILLIPIMLYNKKILLDDLQIHFIRGVILFLATASWTYGLSITDMTTATVIGSSIPLMIFVLSSIFLKEKVMWQRWIFVIVGLLGIIITLNPSSNEFNFQTLILFLSALFFAILDVINKKIVSKKSISIMLLYSSIVVTVLSLLPMIFYWQLPSNSDLLLLMILGINSNLILFFILKAFLYSDVSALAPYRYLELLISGIASYFIFQELPQNNILYGGIIIVSSIVFIIRSEYKKN